MKELINYVLEGCEKKMEVLCTTLAIMVMLALMPCIVGSATGSGYAVTLTVVVELLVLKEVVKACKWSDKVEEEDEK